MMTGEWCRYRLDFRFTAITSRERLRHKDTYFIRLHRDGVSGLGEAALFRGLSCDDRPDYEEMLSAVCREPDRYAADPALLDAWPSIKMGFETAVADLEAGGVMRPFNPAPWCVPINGLIWMGDRETMRARVDAKLAEGFGCIKIKIGGIDFADELDLLGYLRSQAPELQIRLDANGAFTPAEALGRLERLAAFGIHSIEQPIRAGQWEEMARICRDSAIPVALDEELIGLNDTASRERMLGKVRPAYVIIKPTLCGGFSGSEEWIRLAAECGAGWWATSALESNVGLNAIGSWLSRREVTMPQGLGTGQLYHNNIPSPLMQTGGTVSVNPSGKWDTRCLF